MKNWKKGSNLEQAQCVHNPMASLCSHEDSEQINFEDLFKLEDTQRLQDDFARATGVASIITYPDGTPITRPVNFSRLCNDIIRKTEKGLVNCYRSDAVSGRLSPDGSTIQPCLSCGIIDAGAAISVGGQHVANWLIGQVRDENQSKNKIREYAEMMDGFAMHKIICDEQGQPVDYLFLIANPSFELITGLKSNDIVGKTVCKSCPT